MEVNILTLKKLSADEEFKAEYEYWLKYEREKYLHGKKGFKYLHGKKGFEEGLEVGETKKAIEDVINLIKKMNITLDQAISILEIDTSYKSQIETKVKELGIK